MSNRINFYRQRRIKHLILAVSLLFLTIACAPKEPQIPEVVLAVPVEKITTSSYETKEFFPGIVSGINTVEIKSQVTGYLEQIFVDEGAFVKQGQILFSIQENKYQQNYQAAVASKDMALATLKKTQIEYDRVERLEQANVVSKVQLQTLEEELIYAKAAVRKAVADEKLAQVNKAFTKISAPVSGYIGRIPFKKGALVGGNEKEALTILSDIATVQVYFSMSETDFLNFKKRYPGESMEEKIKELPLVQLQLPDHSMYSEEGKIDLVLGQFDSQTAAIGFRATFKNQGNLLRSGNTGRIILPKRYDQVIHVPQSTTFSIQDKTMVYTVAQDNTVHLAPLTIIDKDAYNYVVSGGLSVGDRIVIKGPERLKEGQRITPTKE